MQTQQVRLENTQVATVREVVVEDAKAALQYVNCVAAETDFLAAGEGEFNWPIEKECKFIADHRKADNKMMVLAEIGGRIVGMANFTGEERSRMRHTGELGISVLQEYWGQGVGSALMDYLIEWAKQSGVVRKMNLRTRVDNRRAMRLYRRSGFVQEGIITRLLQVDGKFYDAYLLGLEIDP